MTCNEEYKTYSNTDLLKIIEHPDNYQPQAVDTAKTVFSGRQLTAIRIITILLGGLFLYRIGIGYVMA